MVFKLCIALEFRAANWHSARARGGNGVAKCGMPKQ